MVFFLGEYPRQLDERGRFILPAKIREKLSGTVYITKSPLDKCLNLYTEEEWEQISIEPIDNNVLTEAMRYYYSETQPTEEGNYWRYVDGEVKIWK